MNSPRPTMGKIQISVISLDSKHEFDNGNVQKEPKSIFKPFSETVLQIFSFKRQNTRSISTDPGGIVIDCKPEPRILDENEEEEKKWGKYTGMFLAIMSSFVFSVSCLFVKSLTHYNPITIALWRFQGALWPALPFFIEHLVSEANIKDLENMKKAEQDRKMPKKISTLKTIALVMARSILSCNSLLLNFFALKYLDIGDALVISSATPIFVTLVAHKILGEKCGIVPIISAVLTLCGVIVISRPPHLTGEEAFDLNSLIGTSLALACMILATLSFVILRYIRTVHFSITTVGFGGWGTLENLVLALAFDVFSLPEGMRDWMLASGLVLLTFVGQVFIILAFKCEQAGFVSLFKTSEVVFAFLWQIIWLGRIPDRYSFIGSLIIVFCICLTAFRKWLSSLPANNSTRRRLKFILL